MIRVEKSTKAAIRTPISLSSREFVDNKEAHFTWLRENDPVHKGRIIGPMSAYFLSRYEDCAAMLKDPRFVRNRRNATGKGGKVPFPLPASMRLLMNNMILEDEPEHRRLRTLVHKAFTPRQLARLGARIEELTAKLLDRAESRGEMELVKDFARPIPATVIAEMVGVDMEELPEFLGYIDTITHGLSGFAVFKTVTFDLPRATRYVRTLVERKRAQPADDILTGLIHAEEEGERLNEDELVAMVFLLIVPDMKLLST